MNDVYERDIINIVSDNSIPWGEFENKTILVTGATGLIGAMICRALLMADTQRGMNIRIAAMCRSREKAERVFADSLGDEHLKLTYCDINSAEKPDMSIDYIIHGASVTGSRDFVERPVDTITTAIRGTENMLKIAAECHAEGFLYLSSLEVYGVTDPDAPTITEKDGGYIDTMSVRSSYSEGKRMCETLCGAYAAQYGVNARVVRLSQTFGAGVEYNDGRVFAMLARSVIERKDIVLRTDGSTVRNYCYLADAVSAILIALVRGENGKAYNIANRDTAISIRELAELMCTRYPESGIKVVYDIAEDVTKLGYNPKVVIRLDPTEMEKLGWRPQVGIGEMFDRTIAYMRGGASNE